MIDHLDACARALLANGIPCVGYQLWDDDAGIHYYFDLARSLTDDEQVILDAILHAYITGGQDA